MEPGQKRNSRQSSRVKSDIKKNLSPATRKTQQKNNKKPKSHTWPCKEKMKIRTNTAQQKTTIYDEDNIDIEIDSFDSLNIELPSFEKENKKRSSKSKNESFERYGIVLPSIQDILKENQEFDTYKDLVEQAISLKDVLIEIPSINDVNKSDKIRNTRILDCKHLNLQQLKTEFENSFHYINGIFTGNIYSERHQRFHNYNKTFVHTTKDLTYNTSMVVFNFEQIEYLLSLLHERLGDQENLTEYFFKVLLPELCLQIFMRIHHMSRKRALDYLDSRPLID